MCSYSIWLYMYIVLFVILRIRFVSCSIRFSKWPSICISSASCHSEWRHEHVNIWITEIYPCVSHSIYLYIYSYVSSLLHDPLSNMVKSYFVCLSWKLVVFVIVSCFVRVFDLYVYLFVCLLCWEKFKFQQNQSHILVQHELWHSQSLVRTARAAYTHMNQLIFICVFLLKTNNHFSFLVENSKLIKWIWIGRQFKSDNKKLITKEKIEFEYIQFTFLP